ncbi:hypothetical protein LZ32DRAFT_229498 [Colletotrichum eremochloae]|nr:hypothetical protein LZ32DRAFT_229498 [Colletotrichum eremochloae]
MQEKRISARAGKVPTSLSFNPVPDSNMIDLPKLACACLLRPRRGSRDSSVIRDLAAAATTTPCLSSMHTRTRACRQSTLFSPGMDGIATCLGRLGKPSLLYLRSVWHPPRARPTWFATSGLDRPAKDSSRCGYLEAGQPGMIPHPEHHRYHYHDY